MQDTLVIDLTRAAGVLKLLAPHLEERAEEAVRCVAEALNAIVDEYRARRRLETHVADMAEVHRELCEQSGEPDAKVVSACLDRHGKQWPKGF